MGSSDVPDSPDSGFEELLRRGEESAGRQAWQEARAFFARARELAPADWRPLRGLGISAFWLGRREDAWNLLVQVLRAAPQESDNATNLLDVAQATGREDEARELLAELSAAHPGFAHLAQAAPTHPSPAEPLCAQGERLLETELWNEAVFPFLEAVDLEPSRSRAWSGLGIACFRKGLRRASLAFFEMAIRLEPADEDSVLNYAQAGFLPAAELSRRLAAMGVEPALAEKAMREASA